MGQRFPGPVCQVKDWFADPIDPGTLALTTHHPPAHKHKHHHHPPKLVMHKLPIVVFDERRLLAFLHSAARAKVLARRVNVVWQEAQSDEESIAEKAMNVIYAAYSPWVGHQRPGFLTIKFGDESRIDAEVEATLEDLSRTFAARISRKISSGLLFLEEQQAERKRNIEIVDRTFRQLPLESGRAFRESFHLLVEVLIAVECASTITFKVAGGFAKNAWAFLGDIAYDVSTTLITEWDEASKAQMAVAVKKSGVAGGADLVQKADEALAERMVKAFEKAIEEGRLPEFNKIFDVGGLKTEEEIFKKISAGFATFQRTHLGRAIGKGFVKGAARGIKVLWIGKDIFLAIRLAINQSKELGDDWARKADAALAKHSL